MRAALAIVVALWATPAHAQVVVPTEEQKHDALLQAYHMNGDSMVRWGTIDMTKVPTAPPVEMPPTVTVEKPVAKPPKRAVVLDTCTRHGLRKVITDGGRSWRCL